MKTRISKIAHLIVAGVAMAIGFLVAFVLGECGLIAIQKMINP